MELYVILADWCAEAEASNKTVSWMIELRNDGAGIKRDARTFCDSGLILRDIGKLLDPPANWIARWRGSTRRAAGRRTLHGMMRIYCPDLLEAFEVATSDRHEWSSEVFDLLETRDASVDQVAAEVDAMEATLEALKAVQVELRELITGHFPLGVAAVLSSNSPTAP